MCRITYVTFLIAKISLTNHYAGNPGNEQFYAHFGQTILSKISRIMQISRENSLFCTISHLNHVPLPEKYSELNRVSLVDQIEYKFNFCIQYLPKTAKFILIGHSIGSYLMLRILPDLLKHKFNVIRCIALFPTIEHMAESPNGKRLLPWLKMMLSCLRYLPNSVKERICTFLMGNGCRYFPPCILQSAIEIIDVNVIRNIIFMAVDELITVHLFIYLFSDSYLKLTHVYSLNFNLVIIDDKKCEHAFVLNHGELVANEVVKWITECYD
uniref:Lipid droplet-associated hydrolase n=1 Tax=Brugia malayi TaxID=6279 RepID=A0A1I9G7J5_BRUMA|nr:Bm3603 [Brugia malayi]